LFLLVFFVTFVLLVSFVAKHRPNIAGGHGISEAPIANAQVLE